MSAAPLPPLPPFALFGAEISGGRPLRFSAVSDADAKRFAEREAERAGLPLISVFRMGEWRR